MKFGTDGIRGRAGEVLTVGLAEALGNAVVQGLGPEVWLARDTRPSGPELLAAAVRGVVAAGGRATVLGVLPTPGLSQRVAATGASAGIMVTASHNPPEDNGLKVLGSGGGKLDGPVLAALSAALDTPVARPGGTERTLDATGDYVAALLAALPPGRWLAGRRVLLDAAAGAGERAGVAVLEALGAEVVRFAGPAINVGCGAVHPEFAARVLLAERCDLGVLLDGDGDRIALLDASGRVLDGDALLWLGRRGPVMVGTVMTNLGLETALRGEGIALVRSAVGDAEVAAEMRRIGASVGGEPSGHLLFADGPPTADGLYAGLRAVAAHPTLDTAGFTPCAQAHAAVRDVALPPLDLGFVAAAGGRAVVRKSGTEPVVRVMVEHAESEVASALRERIVAMLPRTEGGLR